MKSQELIHWLEQGAGAVWLRRALVGLAALLVTGIFSWKQFHGFPNEWSLQQAELGRQVAHGEGFTTLINYPQTYAVMKARGVSFDEKKPYPELHHAPLYPMLLAAVFRVLPESIWAHRPEQPMGWAPDYAVLVVNLLLFWTTIWLVWRTAKKLFDGRAAKLAALATAVSVTLWQQTVTLSGLPLMMVLVVGLCHVFLRFEEEVSGASPSRRGLLLNVALLGVLGALLFLTEYSAGLVVPTIGAYLAGRIRASLRWPALGVFAGTALLLIAPWLIRNTLVAGHPLGLAWQHLALKADDTTAFPWAQKNLASNEPPGLDFKKLGNKGLSGMELNLQERLWSGGGLLLTAFFIAGLAYQFQYAPANRTRWCFAALALVLLAGQPFLGSGESPRLPAYYLAPLLIVFGAGFFLVLMDSQPRLASRWGWVAAGLLVLQGLPLVRDCLEPRKIHFHYPPYFPVLFMELRKDAQTRFQPGTAIVADVPAGMAWYGQMRVWSKPERLRDFYGIMLEQNVGALLLTPVTLDRPFFTELAARREDAIQLNDTGGWGGVYAGLVTRRMPAGFPLSLPPQRLTENMVLLVNPTVLKSR